MNQRFQFMKYFINLKRYYLKDVVTYNQAVILQ